jgi:hypothetical protein
MSNVVQFRGTTAVLTLVAASIGGGLIAAFAVSHNSNAGSGGGKSRYQEQYRQPAGFESCRIRSQTLLRRLRLPS